MGTMDLSYQRMEWNSTKHRINSPQTHVATWMQTLNAAIYLNGSYDLLCDMDDDTFVMLSNGFARTCCTLHPSVGTYECTQFVFMRAHSSTVHMLEVYGVELSWVELSRRNHISFSLYIYTYSTHNIHPYKYIDTHKHLNISVWAILLLVLFFVCRFFTRRRSLSRLEGSILYGENFHQTKYLPYVSRVYGNEWEAKNIMCSILSTYYS